MSVSCPVPLESGQKIEVTLTLDDGSDVPLNAEVVWAKQREGSAGVRFLDLPKASSDALHAALERMLQKQDSGRVQSVVIVEDDGESLAFLRAALEPYRVRTITALSNEEVLSLCRRYEPALVVLDILTPGLDAMDVCRHIRADVETANIPVIFFSSLEAPRLHALAEEAGATDYLGQQADLSEMVRLFGAYLANG